MKAYIITIVLFLLYCKVASGQNPVIPPVYADWNEANFKLVKLEYNNIVPDNEMVPIKYDDNSGFIDNPIWEELVIEGKPVVYPSGKTMNISAYFDIKCDNPVCWAKSTNVHGYNFPPQLLVKKNGLWKYNGICEIKFPDLIVDYIDNFELRWKINFNPPNGIWKPAGNTINDVYVIHKYKPSYITAPVEQLISTVHIGCIAAQSGFYEDQIIDFVNKAFETKCVKKRNGSICMRYWGGYNPLNSTGPLPSCRGVKGLYEFEDSNCGEWASLFRDALKYQGIDCKLYEVIPNFSISNFSTDLLSALGNIYTIDQAGIAAFTSIDGHVGIYRSRLQKEFFVKNHSFAQGTPFYLSTFNLNTNQSILPFPTTIALSNGNTISPSSTTGISAQNNIEPIDYFTNHAVVEVKNKFYDPSYGTTPFATENKWEDSALDGFGLTIRIAYNENGKKVFKDVHWIGALNNSAMQTVFIPH